MQTTQSSEQARHCLGSGSEEAHVLQGPSFRQVALVEFAALVEILSAQHELVEASQRLRGTWITPELAVQCVHGSSMKAVRILCVVPKTEECKGRIEKVFQMPRGHFEAIGAVDPLDMEERVLVKVPYNKSFQACVLQERQALAELQGLHGIPELTGQIFFEDVDIHAVAYRYSGAPTLQDLLEEGKFVPLEDIHRLLGSILKTFKAAHARGWLHVNLQPKDVLFPASSGDDTTAAKQPILICGWSNAVKSSDAELDYSQGGLMELVDNIIVKQSAPPPPPPVKSEGSSFSSGSDNSDSDDEEAQSHASVNAIDMSTQAALSLYSAPEQVVSLFADMPCVSAATDVYRAAAVTLMAMCAQGPFGTQGHTTMEPDAARSFDVLRRLCFETAVWRCEPNLPEEQSVANQGGKVQPGRPCAASRQLFKDHVHRLLMKRPELSKCTSQDLQPLFRQMLAREPAQRTPSAADALDALDDAWSSLEGRLLSERMRESETSIHRRVRREGSMAARVSIKPPPGLDDMKVL